ncbi:lanthionine synthetase LanC family protein [Pedobacter sp. NJ-S-72]
MKDSLIKQFQNLDLKGLNNGLQNGKAGYAILNFLLFRFTNNEFFEDKAITLLNEISENINDTNDTGFANGLSGIAWAIEWISKNDFLNINTDEILSDIDDRIYRSIIHKPDDNFYLNNGSLGKLLYLASRHKTRNPRSNRFNKIYIEECLVILSDEIYKTLINNGAMFIKEPRQEFLKKTSAYYVFFIPNF